MPSNGRLPTPYPAGGQAWKQGGGFGPQFNLLAPNDFLYKVWEDGFVGDAILGEYPAAKTNGTSAAVTFAAGNEGGFLELVSGTDNNGYAGQALTDPIFTGDRGFLAEFLISTPSSLATFKMEVGVTDTTSDDAGAVATKATPTANATDFAVLCFDTADDSNLTLIHAKAGTVVAVEDTNFVLAASTYYYVALRVVDDNIRAYIRGLYDVSGSGTPSAQLELANGTAAAGLEGGNKLTPWVFTQSRSASASRTVRLYKWRVTAPAF